MKHHVFFIFLFVSAQQLFAQEPADSTMLFEARQGQKTIIKSNLLPLLWGNILFPGDSNRALPIVSEYRLIAEFPVAPRQSVIAGISYLGKNLPLAALIALGDTETTHPNLHDLAVRGLRIQGMYRLYLFSKHLAPRGFYFGPHFSYSFAKVYLKPFQGYYYKLVNTNFNVLCGGQFFLWNKIAVDSFSGLGYKENVIQAIGPKGKIESTEVNGVFGHVKFTLGVNVGYAF